MSDFQETLNEYYVPPTLINCAIREQLGMKMLQPIVKAGHYSEGTPPEQELKPAKTLKELLGIFGGVRTIDGNVITIGSSKEINERFNVKLIAMKAWMNPQAKCNQL